MFRSKGEAAEPDWLTAMRTAAKQRPRTQFIRIRWIHLQSLLRERDALWDAANSATRAQILAARDRDTYAYEPPRY